MEDQTPLAIAAGLGWGATGGLAIALWVALMRFGPPPRKHGREAPPPTQEAQMEDDDESIFPFGRKRAS